MPRLFVGCIIQSRPPPQKRDHNKQTKGNEMSAVKIGRVQGGKTKKSYPVHWDPDTKHVFVEKSGLFSSTLVDTKGLASRGEMAMHVAEAFVYDK